MRYLFGCGFQLMLIPFHLKNKPLSKGLIPFRRALQMYSHKIHECEHGTGTWPLRLTPSGSDKDAGRQEVVTTK